MGLRTASNNFVYDKPYAEVFEAAKKALEDCNFEVKEANEKTGEISASAGMTLLSWGENIDISISEIGKNQTRVGIYSGAKAQFIDWGKSEKNVHKFFAALDRRLRK
jgi:hypothetical protein